MQNSIDFNNPQPFDFNPEFLLRKSWENFKKTPTRYILMALLLLALQLLSLKPGGQIFTITGLLISPVLLMYILGYAWQNSRENYYPNFQLIFHNDRIPMLILLNIITSLMVTAGIFFLVIPGIIIFIATILSSYLLLFGGLNIIDSLKGSFAFVFKNFRKFLIVFFIILLINVLGALALGVGILISLPITYIFIFEIYDHIIGADNLL